MIATDDYNILGNLDVLFGPYQLEIENKNGDENHVLDSTSEGKVVFVHTLTLYNTTGPLGGPGDLKP